MNNLTYPWKDPNKVAPRIEEKLRQELQAAAPLGYQVQRGDAEGPSLGEQLGQALVPLVPFRATALFHLRYELPGRRPTEARISVNDDAFGCYTGTIVFTCPLGKPVAGEAALGRALPFPWLFKSKFKGEPQLCKQLNGNRRVVSLANAVARATMVLGRRQVSIPRLCKVLPDGAASRLVVATLPKPSWLGLKASTGVADFCALADLIDSIL